ncbi:MAG: GTP 3',8-cyclase MoaA [Dethiobacteria bacterium]|jgi:cyclic pyranopterin phosphate synthase
MGDLFDRFGRKINYLRLSVTERCNLNCFYCRSGPLPCYDQQKKELQKDDFLQIIRTAAGMGITRVRFTGGEPLLYPQIVALVEETARMKAIKDLSMTTNGILLPKFAYTLAEAGLKRINISIDSLQASRFKRITRGGILDSVLTGIETALDAGFTPVKLNIVLLKNINEGEIIDFVKMTQEQNLHVRFIEYMPIGSELVSWKKYFVPLQKVIEVCKELGKLIPTTGEHGGPARYFRLEDSVGKVGLITPLSRHFCDSCNRLRVTSDGKIKPCLLSATEVDASAVLREKNPLPLLKQKFREAINLKPDPSRVANNAVERAKQLDGYRKMNEIGG